MKKSFFTFEKLMRIGADIRPGNGSRPGLMLIFWRDCLPRALLYIPGPFDIFDRNCIPASSQDFDALVIINILHTCDPYLADEFGSGSSLDLAE
jgi:hypothetical protein